MKQRFSYTQALSVANWLKKTLQPAAERIEIVGSIRRKKHYVGDVEVLLIPKIQEIQLDLEFFPQSINLAEVAIKTCLGAGELAFRPKKNGTIANGSKVKLLIHCATQIPVDIFLTTPQCWFSALVCRTGGKLNNEEIAKRAIIFGYNWLMGGEGFKEQVTGRIVPMQSEQQIFQFVGLPYLLPEQRQ